jgi:hypothetical protein
VRYVIGHLPQQLHRVPTSTTKAYCGVGPVTQVEYRDAGGQPVTLPGAKLAELHEYTYQASKLGP